MPKINGLPSTGADSVMTIRRQSENKATMHSSGGNAKLDAGPAGEVA